MNSEVGFDDEEGYEVISPPPQAPAPGTAVEPWSGDTHGRRFNISPVTDPGTALWALNEGERLIKAEGKTIVMVDVVQQEVDFKNKANGEIKRQWRTAIIADDGTAYVCSSDGVKGSIDNIVMFFGRPPWPQGIRVYPKTRDLPEGHRLLILVTEKGQKPPATQPAA